MNPPEKHLKNSLKDLIDTYEILCPLCDGHFLLPKKIQELLINLKHEAEQEHSFNIQLKDKIFSYTQKLNSLCVPESSELKGEILEKQWEKKLRSCFPEDRIEEIPKGKKGPDLIQTITYYDYSFKILWEFKNTQSFSNNWISKLKQEKASFGADLCILVTSSFPSSQKHQEIFFYEDILVLKEKIAKTGPLFIRQMALEILKINLSLTTFKERQWQKKSESLLALYQKMSLQLEQEKILMQKKWKEEEKNLQEIKALLF